MIKRVDNLVPRASILILCPNTNKAALYENWMHGLPLPVTFLTDYDENLALGPDIRMLITHEHRTNPTASLCCRAMDLQIPVLILPDGIIEYRNTWQRPDAVPLSVFQPVQGHKFASMGPLQSRILNAWGNHGKCEDVGCPRFDTLLSMRKRTRSAASPFRFLVMTANRPAFTPGQEAEIFRSLMDILEWSRTHGRDCEFVWRLTEEWATRLGVDNTLAELSTSDLSNLLQNVDAVITTPSTTILESMILDLPVVGLDYTNSPAYLQTAWNITCSNHIEGILGDVMNSPSQRMLFQEQMLHDALLCHSPAAPRMVLLVEQMLAVAGDCRNRGVPLSFPDALLSPGRMPQVTPPPDALLELYNAKNKRAERSLASMVSESTHAHQSYLEAQVFLKIWRDLEVMQKLNPERHVLIYGAGKYLRRFFKAASTSISGPNITAVLDDNADGTRSIAGHTIVTPDLLPRDGQYIVFLATDAHEELMASRCREMFGKEAEIVRPSAYRSSR